MSYVQVAHTRMITHENGVTGVYVQVAQPVSNLSAALFAHDSIDVAWRVGLTFKPSDNQLIWQAGTKLDPSLPPLLEVGNFIESTDTFLGRLAPGPVRFVHVRPVGDTGIWAEGPAAQVELARVEAERAQKFMQPIVAPGSAQDAPEFVILAVAEGLLITQPQRVPGISLTPFKAELGDDVMNVLNRIIRGRGIRTILDPQAWRKQMQSNRPAVLIECHVQAESVDTARCFSREKIKRLLDMMTLSRGAAATLIAGVAITHTGQGKQQLHGAWIERGGYTENLLGGPLAGEDAHGLQKRWAGMQANPRAQLWVSLYADAVRDPRWDYQFFRCFSLLEAIADEVVPASFPIVDEAGNPRPLGNGNKNYSTKEARGKVYALLLRLDGAAANDSLWDSVGLWYQVRNDVAHEGEWQAPTPNESALHAAARAAIINAGHDGTFESGTRPFGDMIRDYVKRTLYAAIFGSL
ncbi:hypothetical protein KL864_34355 [Mycolicibacterium goodii]|uniref:hypothetical protein n=1 Tax=Mycolicibacterium goodii TaxID=134601 RepID=UPI001BDCEA37|nr:hypothetical protein [Mycolicibacterium goodii]MBU8820944.1 hypothetical protein [Mycolicibacterium goodii]